MDSKVVRIFAALFVLVGLFGTVGSVQASTSTLSPADQPLQSPSLSIPPASSLGVQFVQVANTYNMSGNSVIIDHPLTNNNPNAIIIVTPDWNPGSIGGTYDNHPLGVYYDGSKWRIFHQDLAVMAAGTAFNVLIPTAGAGVFVHTDAGVGLPGSTEIDNALTNNNPNARILVTANWNPGGGSGTYNIHSIGVWYYATDHRWTIFNQDLGAMPLGAAFNVFVLPAYTGAFVQTTTASNIAGDYTMIDNPLTNNRPNALLFITPNRNPGGVGGATYTNNYGVWTDGNHWFIFNQDVSTMPANVSFNVLVLIPTADAFPHWASAANTFGNYTNIDNTLTNAHPNAVVLATSNYNPNGIGDFYNNHNIGVFYGTGANQWAVFNQDGAPITLSTAFNVVIPNPDASVFVHKATAANSASQYTILNYPLVNANPNAAIFVTPNWNPGGVGGLYDNHPFGVFYASGSWRIFHEDDAAMTVGASFNVFVPPPGPSVFVQFATVANIAGNHTIIDNPLTNMNPHAILLVTPNFTPGGTGSGIGGLAVYDNHPIGVYYDAGRWAIFNQDLAAMPVFASFNVYVVPLSKLYLPLIIR